MPDRPPLRGNSPRAPAGLRYSERELWESCPEVRDVLARLARCRAALREVEDILGSSISDKRTKAYKGLRTVQKAIADA